MARKRRGSGHGGDGGGGGHSGASGRWLVSYADFVTLMFVVFVVLFSMARLDASKYGSLARSLNQALGPVGPDIPPLPARGQLGTAMPVVAPDRPGNLPDIPDWPAYLTVPVADGERAQIPPVDPPVTTTPPAAEAPGSGNTKPTPSAPPPAPTDSMQGLAEVFSGLPGVRSGVVALALEERGLVLSIAGRLLFDPGQATLKTAAYGELDSILAQLQRVEYPIMVIGNADETPVQSELSPWKLAGLRASEVVEYLVRKGGMSGSSFTTIGYGSDGAGQGNASANVTIVVMRKKSE